MESTESSEAALDRALAPYGLMNFHQACTADGHPARLTMNTERVFLTVHDIGTDVNSDTFASVGASGTGSHRQVRIAGGAHDLTFDTDAAAARFDRVLGVRQSSATQQGPINYPSGPLTGFGATARDPAQHVNRSYHAYANYVMTTSVLLLVLGWLNLVAGVIVAIMSLVSGSPVGALLWLLLALAGSAVPLCLGSFARMTVYRNRVLDGAATN